MKRHGKGQGRPSVLIFDLDGTLVDSMGELGEMFSNLLAETHAIPRDLSNEVYFALAGVGPKRQFETVLHAAGLPLTSVDALTRTFFERTQAIVPKPFPDVLDVLQAFDADRFEMFISSGGRTEYARIRAEHGGIAGFMRLILGTDEEVPGMAKGPGHFALFADALGISAEALSGRAWFIGDGPFDMQVAREAGIFALGRLTGDNGQQLRQAGADVLVSDLREVRALLQGAP
ncbi:MAG TPA: HAD family hydrolase [Dehalococcoidia bacterium]|nr:HAD family hydrolase [Dehalococcoidia bacterium]